MTAMDRKPQNAGEKIRNRSVDEVVKQQRFDIISPLSSTNSFIIPISRRRTFDSDDVYRQWLDDHVKRTSDYESKMLKMDEDRSNFQTESEAIFSSLLSQDQDRNDYPLNLEKNSIICRSAALL